MLRIRCAHAAGFVAVMSAFNTAHSTNSDKAADQNNKNMRIEHAQNLKPNLAAADQEASQQPTARLANDL